MSFLRYPISRNVVALKSGSEVTEGHWKWYHLIDWYAFLLVFYSNFVPKTHHFWDIRLVTIVTLKPRLGVTQGHRNRHVSISNLWFLLTFHSNCGPISYHFRNNRRFQSKIATFSHPMYFALPLKGSPLELGTSSRGQNNRMTGLPGREKSLTISSAI